MFSIFTEQPLVVAVFLVFGLVIGYAIRQVIGAKRAHSIENRLKEQLSQAKNEAQDIVLKSKEKAVAILDEVKKDEKERKNALDRLEERVLRKEEELNTKERG